MPVQQIGQRMTSQRKLLLNIIRQADEHLDADGIYRLARDKDPRISLSTVYRNLHILKEAGLVAEHHLGEEHHYYELRTVPQHHHLVCLNCGAVYEFESPYTGKMKSAVEAASHYTVESIEINMKGYCPRCQEAPDS